ncbi:hypothetical protein KEM54_003464, partial [Ascosphaera aggregata]
QQQQQQQHTAHPFHDFTNPVSVSNTGHPTHGSAAAIHQHAHPHHHQQPQHQHQQHQQQQATVESLAGVDEETARRLLANA